MRQTFLVGYNTDKWIIRQRLNGKYVACRFSIVNRLDGTQFLATQKEEIRSDLVNIHEETFDLS